MDFSEAEKANDFIKDNARKYGEMVAHREDQDDALKALRAKLMNEVEGTVSEKDAHALNHPVYLEVRKGRAVAREEEIRLKLLIQAAQNQFEAWRSWNSANKRGA